MASIASGLRHASFQLAIRSITNDAQKPSITDLEASSAAESVLIPYQGVTHARVLPATPSYFSREPLFNDLYIGISKLLTKYNHLPTVPPSEAPQMPWTKLEEMRAQMGEPIKSSHYAKVMRVAKRLNLIEPSLRPAEVTVALTEFTRDINPFLNMPNPIQIDKFGRAVGVGKRKESTARAFVVEGTGEILVNGKTLSEAFGRVHDRESAVWALTATERLDKYNVWVLVEGGGTTGQAEAITLAVAKALVAHEPALKTALRKAGCITRDPRTVERKKHGHVKARKMPAWVKR
ncbi:37S ribosomal protein S9, mitochondrial [Trichoderma asperellum]|uniref:Small ribosomal subunit protein uS9m n=1 Tax=Trichoderma asperellum TaxID=101201 RepID=A0A6V8QS41_TRIAP|nr:37S ribosomal protein S9, mitochondrial [Trichoderma asperellum]